MKIVILDGYTVNPGDTTWADLEKLGQVAIYDRTAPSDIINRIGDAEAVFTSKCFRTAIPPISPRFTSPPVRIPISPIWMKWKTGMWRKR